MIEIPQSLLDLVRHQAETEYPHECCGLLFGPPEHPGILLRYHPCRNVQDLMHAEDPAHFPRTAREAYFVDPVQLLRALREARNAGEQLRVICHSHVETGPFFSREDEALAVLDGNPLYEGVYYLIISVLKRMAVRYHLYGWEPGRKAFGLCSEGEWGEGAGA
jgi:[CysO sulfur-carrier protein]-S-L-cysteine hydrolase